MIFLMSFWFLWMLSTDVFSTKSLGRFENHTVSLTLHREIDSRGKEVYCDSLLGCRVWGKIGNWKSGKKKKGGKNKTDRWVEKMLEGTAASKTYHNHSWKVYKRILQLPGRPEPRAILAHKLERNYNSVIHCFKI